MKEKKRFMTLTMILTTDCNLNCSYCFCGKKYKKYMDIRAAILNSSVLVIHLYVYLEENLC